MIRIVLLGRTGNNLFQYAIGRVLAKKHGVQLVLDGSWFNAQGWSEVSHFLRLPIRAQVVRRLSVGMRALRKVSSKHYWEYRRIPMLRETSGDMSFQSEFLNAPPDCLLFGYFQSYRYFESIADELRKEINQLLDNYSQAESFHFKKSLLNDQSVAVHVRRGDFMLHPAFHVCGEHYYHVAMNKMRMQLDGAQFFIFSDDPKWCKQHFKYSDTQIIDSGASAANPLHDLYLMSRASHHIIANSSYSWWAAWLGQKLHQRVITPSRWFSDNTNAPMEDKLLPGWESVSHYDERLII